MPNRWQLHQARARLSHIVDLAIKKGPQVITRRGKDAVVMMSIWEYERFEDRPGSLVEFFQKSPLRKLNLDLERAKDLPRPPVTSD